MHGCNNSAQQCVYVVFVRPHGYEDSIHEIVAVYAHEDDAKAHVARSVNEFDYEARPLGYGRP